MTTSRNSFHEYETAFREHVLGVSRESALRFCVSTLKRHYAAMKKDGVLPFAHETYEKIAMAVDSLRADEEPSRDQLDELTIVTQLANPDVCPGADFRD